VVWEGDVMHWEYNEEENEGKYRGYGDYVEE
jgi:hypothetical protein